MINYVVVDKDSIKSSGAFKAHIRLGGILIGKFRCNVDRYGVARLFLPGGEYSFDKKRWYEPITALHRGEFKNRELKERILQLSRSWYRLHVKKQAVDVRDLPKIPFSDPGWTKETEVFVRPVSYTPPEQAETEGRPWDAGEARVVFLNGDVEISARIPIRRRPGGLEAALPKWTITETETDHLGRPVEVMKYVPRFRFHAGAGYIDGAVLGAVALIWAWYFRVPEPFVDRTGKCVSCRFLEYVLEEKGTWEKDDPVPRRWWCSAMGHYIDDTIARDEYVRDLQRRGKSKQVAWELGASRFYNTCENWESAEIFDFSLLRVKGKTKTYGADDILKDRRLTRSIRQVSEPVVFFDAPGYEDKEGLGASVPDVRIWVRPLLEGAPKRDYWKEGVLTPPSGSDNITSGGVNPPSSDVPF